MQSKELEKWMAQIRKGSLDLCILALLNRRAQYTFELIQNLKEIDGLIVTEGTIYPLLNRLQSAGLIASFWAESPSGPPRKYYQVTEYGNTLLAQMVTEWKSFANTLNLILKWSQDDGKNSTKTNPPVPLKVKKQP